MFQLSFNQAKMYDPIFQHTFRFFCVSEENAISEQIRSTFTICPQFRASKGPEPNVIINYGNHSISGFSPKMAPFRVISLKLTFYILRKKVKLNVLIYKNYFQGSGKFLLNLL